MEKSLLFSMVRSSSKLPARWVKVEQVPWNGLISTDECLEPILGKNTKKITLCEFEYLEMGLKYPQTKFPSQASQGAFDQADWKNMR